MPLPGPNAAALQTSVVAPFLTEDYEQEKSSLLVVTLSLRKCPPGTEYLKLLFPNPAL